MGKFKISFIIYEDPILFGESIYSAREMQALKPKALAVAGINVNETARYLKLAEIAPESEPTYRFVFTIVKKNIILRKDFYVGEKELKNIAKRKGVIHFFE